MEKLIAQGAEAKLYLKGKDIIVKNRFKKTYRLEKIDNLLRKSRTRREAKVLDKLSEIGFPAPKLLASDDKETIEMELVKGKKIRDILEKSDYKAISREIGEKVAVLHNNTIIHGDLTTSNMIYDYEAYFIDFGLSFFSYKVEDMAVDLHLLKQALESKHYTISESSFKAIVDGYLKKSKQGEEVLNRLDVVESRGRYKGKR